MKKNKKDAEKAIENENKDEAVVEDKVQNEEEVEVQDKKIEGEKEESPEKKELEDMKLFNSKLKDDNEKLSNELETMKDRILRLTAEYDNYRKRTAKEKEGIYTDACSDVINEMLPSLDNLERAATSSGSAEDIKKGIDMTIRQFKEALTKLGVEEIPGEGAFDPNFHNAVMHIEDENYGESEIVEVLQKGYKRGDKVLRHSMVKVAN
ncbi:nucleotide exchange factor GrpE [Clostridium guangxiense]|uniref:nucleotide exchange factor GrpE n=1 Tax=Clostridium guangxiense TaxID=1662055 RepID=UPI001E61AF31|nr:nucleotide exchange factor GrpE [Clostridium guangxiense]MCD2347529.1 nucleotide exchange factor GrpE [Clostridium guangxiense]